MDFWLSASQIGVVRVATADWIGPELEMVPPRHTVVRLVRVNGQAEYWIKGTVPAKALTFYFFTNVPTTTGFRSPRSWMEPGQRYIVFLREDGEVLRTMADMEQLQIQVHSGDHSQGSFSSDASLGIRIAALLLTPGENYDSATFARHIGLDLLNVRTIAPAKNLVALLSGLLKNRDDRVRTAACFALAKEYPSQDSCLVDLANAPDDGQRQRARELLALHDRNTPELIKRLAEYPSTLSINGKTEDLGDDLELFTNHRNAEVRAGACRALEHCFPARQVSQCRGRAAKERTAASVAQ
jgi:hypothetical protein